MQVGKLQAERVFKCSQINRAISSEVFSVSNKTAVISYRAVVMSRRRSLKDMKEVFTLRLRRISDSVSDDELSDAVE